MKRAIIIAAMLAAAGLAGAQMFAQIFGGETWTPAALGPVAWYKAESNALDSARANNGTWIGTAAYVTGKIGNAFSLDGSSLVGIGSGASLSASEYTISAWIKTTATAADNAFGARVVTVLRSPATTKTALIQRGAKIGVRTGTIISTASINDGNWHHVVATETATAAAIYVDGTLNASGADTMSTGFYSATIGATGSAAAQAYFTGQIDDVQIYTRILSADEIKKLYDESVKRNGEAW